ncbi:FkbM family methyltransferase [bacterium]|nr:FkbM family methyltransferase [bacterium]
MAVIKEVSVDIGGKKYIITSDDSYLDYIKSGFEPEMVKLFKTLITDCKIILDIGANIGCTAILFSDLGEKVYAFEPSQTTFAFLEKNILHSGKKNIFPQNIGLGEKFSESILTIAPTNRSGAFILKEMKSSNIGFVEEKIIIRQLDEIVENLEPGKIDFIKIDVEGFEGNVIRGAKQTLEKNRPIVVLELNHWCLNAFQRTSIPDFFDLLRSIFPILLAVDGTNYLDLHDEKDSYVVMYHHILNMRFKNIVAGYDESCICNFRSMYKHGFSKDLFNL